MSPHARLTRKARALLGVYYAHMLEYRAEIFFWALAHTLPFIMMGAWVEAARGGDFALGPADFARYFMAVFIVRQLTVVWVIWDFEVEVVEGKLASRLMQPIDPVWRHVAAHLGERLARLPFAAALVALFLWLYPQARFTPSLSDLALFLVAVHVSFATFFLLQYTLSMLAFWTERASALWDFGFLAYFLLSGLLAPLEVYPPAVREVALWTPFPYLLDVPANLLLGRPPVSGSLATAAAVLGAWCLVLLALNRFLWRRGLRHFSAMGA